MPTKTINKCYVLCPDGSKTFLDDIEILEPSIFDDSDIDIRMFSDKTLSFSGKAVITTKNDRNYKSKRYRKNRKGYRGLCELLMQI